MDFVNHKSSLRSVFPRCEFHSRGDLRDNRSVSSHLSVSGCIRGVEMRRANLVFPNKATIRRAHAI